MDQVHGRIDSPDNSIALGIAEPHTGLSIVASVEKTTVGIVGTMIESSNKTTRVFHAPDFEALLVRGMLPGFVSFMVGGGHPRVSNLVRKITAKWAIDKGYRGSVVFTDKGGTVICDIRMKRWVAKDSFTPEEVGDQPPRIRIGGNTKTIRPIISACRAMRLREYLPTHSSPA
ncbi:MAG: hypothetical protein M1312_01070 [Patescibacteria group bacterium]|nr:hypothetical protein [Patescibacteria group bacterium]